MDNVRLKKLAGINEAVDQKGNFKIGTHFALADDDNMQKAVVALLKAGFTTDLSYSMGVYYFNFKSEKVAEEAHKVAAKVIDKKKESKWEE